MCLFPALLLMGCLNKDLNQLTRVDIEIVKTDGNYEESFMITDEKTVDALREIFKQIEWNPNEEAKMARKEDIKATLFFEYDENMPERLFEYKIWFIQSNETAKIISNNSKEGYGRLEKENAQTLKNISLNRVGGGD